MIGKASLLTRGHSFETWDLTPWKNPKAQGKFAAKISLRTLEKVLVNLKCLNCHGRWQRHKWSKRLWKVCWNGYIMLCQEIRIIFSTREPIRYIVHQDHGEYAGETSQSLIYSAMALFQRSGLTVGKTVTQLSLFMAMEMMESLKN